jgi:hypothetical protein
MSTLLVVSFYICIIYNHTGSLYHFTRSNNMEEECLCEGGEEGYYCDDRDGVFTDAQESTCKRSAKAGKGRTGDRGTASANIFSPED